MFFPLRKSNITLHNTLNKPIKLIANILSHRKIKITRVNNIIMVLHLVCPMHLNLHLIYLKKIKHLQIKLASTTATIYVTLISIHSTKDHFEILQL